MRTVEQEKEIFGNLPHIDDWSSLRQKATVGIRTISNRVAYQAMEGCDGTPDGKPDTLTKRRYGRFAAGGPGIIWIEATAVMKEGRANPRQLYLDENNLDDFAALCEHIKSICMKENGFEPFVAVQLTHSGRYSKPNGTPAPLIAVHNAVFEEKNPLSESCIVSDDYLDKLCEKLVNAAVLAERAGFDAADIKCCHRYLLSELCSAYERPGKYGGSFENRTRLLREAVAGARSACGSDFVIASRLNIYDGFAYPCGFGTKENGGIAPDYSEACRLAQILEEEGIGLLNLTMGNPYFNPHVNRPYKRGGYIPDEKPIEGVERMLTGIRTVAASLPGHTPVICSGLSYLGADSPDAAAACIADGWFDFAGFGRMAFANPQLANDICVAGSVDPKKSCMACSMCTELMRAGSVTGCIVRDSEIYRPLYQQYVMKK